MAAWPLQMAGAFDTLARVASNGYGSELSFAKISVMQKLANLHRVDKLDWLQTKWPGSMNSHKFEPNLFETS